MLINKEIPLGRRVYNVVSRLLCLLALVIVAVHLNGMTTVRATSRFSCALGDGLFVSCGSSAGNFAYNCNSGGVCVANENNPANQAMADEMCSRYEREGCPGQLFGDGEAQIEVNNR